MSHHNIFLKQKQAFFIPNRTPRVLLIKLDHRGDFVLNIPAFHKVREKFKGAHLSILCGSWNVEMARQLELFDHIYTYDFFKSSSSARPSRDLPREVELLNSMGHFDIAVDLRRPGDARFLIALVNATIKISYQSFNHFDTEMTLVLDSEQDESFRITDMNKTPTTLQSLRLIDSIPIETFLTSNLHVVKKKSLDDKTLKKIAVFPFSGVAIREWPFERYLTLAEKLHFQLKISIEFYTHNLEERLTEKIKKLEFIHHFDALPLDQLISSIDDVDLIVGNNSFGVHLGSYRGIKTLGIYGGQERVSEWGPIGVRSVALYNEMDCSPCHFGRMEECVSHLQCLDNIEVNDVYSEIEKLLIREDDSLHLDRVFWYNRSKNKIFNVERIFDYKNELKIEYELDPNYYKKYLGNLTKNESEEKNEKKSLARHLLIKISSFLRKQTFIKKIMRFFMSFFPETRERAKEFLGIKHAFVEEENMKNIFIKKKVIGLEIKPPFLL
ncbi:MAG: glycosyltransferase family 9 protein [Leptospirillum sp.]